MADYSITANKAKELIKKYGNVLNGTRDASSGTWVHKYSNTEMRYYWEDSEHNIVYTKPANTDIIIFGYGVMSQWTTHQIASGIVQTGDVKLITQTDTEILTGDKLSFGGKTYTATQPIKNTNPDGTTLIIQEVNCRG